jgi:YVTN family beta-propeller protein
MPAEPPRPGRRGRGPSRVVVSFAIAVSALMFLPSPLARGGPGAPAPPGVLSFPGRLASAGVIAPHLSAAATVGSVVYSWDLSNDTTYFGAHNGSAAIDPASMAFDPVTNRLWVGWGPGDLEGSSNVSLVNPVSCETVGTVPDTKYTEGMLFDPASNTMFLAEVADPATGAGQLTMRNATTGLPIRSAIAIGSYPQGMALDPYAGLLYIADRGDAGVTSVDIANGSVERPLIPTGAGAASVAYDPSTGDVYVANSGANNITVLNASRGTPEGAALSTLPASQLIGIEYDAPMHELLVAARDSASSPGSGSVVLIDPSIQAVVRVETVPGAGPASELLDPISGDLLLPQQDTWYNYPNDGLTVYDPHLDTFNETGIPSGQNTTVQTIDTIDDVDFIGHLGPPTFLSSVNLSSARAGPLVMLGAYPRSGTFDPANGRAYVTNSYAGWDGTEPDQVAEINVSGGVEGAVPIGYLGSGFSGDLGVVEIAYVPPANALLVTSIGSGDAVALNATTGAVENDSVYLGNIQGGCSDDLPGPCFSSVVYDPVVGPYAIASTPWGLISVLNAANLTHASTYFLGWNFTTNYVLDLPYQSLAVRPQDGSLLYLDAANASIWHVNLTSRAYSIRTLGDAKNSVLSGSVYDPLDDCFYVTDYELDEVYVVNASTLATVATIPVGSRPVGLVFNPGNGWIEVTDSGSANLTLLNGSTPASGLVGSQSVPVLPDPEGIFLDPRIGETFVASPQEGIVEALAPVPVLGAFTAGSGVTDVGIPIRLHALASGGTGALQYAYSGLPPGCSSRNAAVIDCVPQAPGTFTVAVNVTDAAAGLVSAKVELTVEPDPTVLVAPTAAAVDGSTAIGFDAVASNGTPPYQVVWSFGDGGGGSGELASHAYASPGSYTAEATLTDAVGGAAAGSARIAVGAVLTVVLTHAGNGSLSGEESLFNATVRGGLAPYEFRWDFGDHQTLVTGASGSTSANSSSVAHRFASPGQYEVVVTVTDTAGGSSAASWPLTIALGPGNGTSHPPAPSAPFPTLPVALAIADLVAAGALGVLLYRHRRGGGHRPGLGPG